MKSRAIRRHHYYRLKEKRLKENYWGLGEHLELWKDHDGAVASCVDTPTPCSCDACGNPRHCKLGTKNDHLTIQERKAKINEKEMED